MFWKKASEWANIAPSSPSAVRFATAATKGYEKLIIVPNDPGAQEFLAKVDRLATEACVDDLSQKEFAGIVDDLELFVSQFARAQRHAIENSISEVHEGLREVLQSLEGAMQSSQDLESATEGASSRLLNLNKARSYDEVIIGIKKEISTLTSAVEKHRDNAKLVRKVASKHVEELRSKLKVAEKAVRTDHLTKLGNRSSFDFMLTVALAKVSQGDVHCLAMLDVDKFKEINDTYGHLCGDAALVEIAKKLSETFSLPGTSVIRYGGDEFAVLYRGNRVQLEAKLARVNNALARTPLQYEGHSLALHASYGSIELEADHTSDLAIAEADHAMYHAKTARRKAA